MEYVTHGYVNPHDVCCSSFARHQSNTIAILGVPSEWETTSKRQVEINQYWLIVDNDVTISDRHVMHHRHTRQRNINRTIHAPVFANAHILHVIHPFGPRINDRVHLTGDWIDLRMRSERTGQGPKKVIASDSFEFVVQFHWTSTSFNHRPCGSGKRPDVGVWSEWRVIPVSSRDIGQTFCCIHCG